MDRPQATLTGMTTPKINELPILRTDTDLLDRIRLLIGPAARDRQLWIVFIDGDGRQMPVMMPISDMPERPEPDTTTGLATVLGGLRHDLVTSNGEGSVAVVLERHGPDEVLERDREWAVALSGACAAREVALRGLFLSSPGGVGWLRATGDTSGPGVAPRSPRHSASAPPGSGTAPDARPRVRAPCRRPNSSRLRVHAPDVLEHGREVGDVHPAVPHRRGSPVPRS